MASNDKTGQDDAVEGSWSPRRSRATSSKVDKGSKDGSATPDTEVLAQEIEETRAELAETLDAIADKVSPKRVVSRNKKAAKDGAADAVEVVKDTVKGGVAAVKEKVAGEPSPLPDSTVSLPGAEVPLEPAPTPGALADAATTVTAPAGAETPAYVSPLPPVAPSRAPVFAGAGAALLVVLLVLRRRRR